VGLHGATLEQELKTCPIGKHAFADPDGVLLDISQ
jgi:hypothetical protein